jgi:hypothetical protein
VYIDLAAATNDWPLRANYCTPNKTRLSKRLGLTAAKSASYFIRTLDLRTHLVDIWLLDSDLEQCEKPTDAQVAEIKQLMKDRIGSRGYGP